MSRRADPGQQDDVRWLALVIMRGLLQIVGAIRERYGLPPLEERR